MKVKVIKRKKSPAQMKEQVMKSKKYKNNEFCYGDISGKGFKKEY